MFEYFKKRNYKICYVDAQGHAAASRTERRSVAMQMMRDHKAGGCTDIVLWHRPRYY